MKATIIQSDAIKKMVSDRKLAIQDLANSCYVDLQKFAEEMVLEELPNISVADFTAITEYGSVQVVYGQNRGSKLEAMMYYSGKVLGSHHEYDTFAYQISDDATHVRFTSGAASVEFDINELVFEFPIAD